MILFILVASFISGIDSQRYVYLSLSVFSACLLVYWILRGESIRKIIKGYFNLWGSKFSVSAENVYESIKISASRLVIPFAYAVFLVFFELLNFKILSSALGLTIPFLTVLLFASLTILIGNLPVTIHGLGTREAAVCFFFSAYGSSDKLLSLGITVSLVEYFLPVVIGLFLTKSFLVQLSGM
ncbi:MAG: lysylphosphatidylglycerol synthase domain-containing protein [Planctomycetota bacterium]